MYWRRTDKEFTITDYEKKLKDAITMLSDSTPRIAWEDMLEFGSSYDDGVIHIFSNRMVEYTDAPINGATHTHMGPIQSDVLVGSIVNRLYVDKSITEYRDRIHGTGVRYETFGPIIHRVHTFEDVTVTYFTEGSAVATNQYNDDIHVQHGVFYRRKEYDQDDLVEAARIKLKEQLAHVQATRQ